MMLDILLTNREKVLEAVGEYQAKLAGLARSLENGDEGRLREALSTIRQKRMEMFP
jgi:prephenate dehydrogenase